LFETFKEVLKRIVLDSFFVDKVHVVALLICDQLYVSKIVKVKLSELLLHFLLAEAIISNDLLLECAVNILLPVLGLEIVSVVLKIRNSRPDKSWSLVEYFKG